MVAEGHAVGVLVSLSDEGGEVLEVAAVGCAAEDDLDDAGVPDRAGLVFAPPVAGLGEGLQDRHGRDPGAAAFGHERRQRRQWSEVSDLIEREQQGRVEPGSG